MSSIGGSKFGIGAVAMVVAISSLAFAAMAGAAAPEPLTRMTAGEGKPGSGAGEVDGVRAMAGSSTTGHIYVTDGLNARIDEYTAWGLFVKSWGWGVLNGAGEAQVCGPSLPEEVPPPGLCQAGSEGSGKGQLSKPNGIALNGVGDVYVVDRNNLRVQEFSPTGQFLVMFGGEVNKTKVDEAAPTEEQNVCPIAPSDVCQAGSTGSAASHLAGTVGNYIAYSQTADAIVVGDKDRIQIFDLDGSYREEIPFTGGLAAFAGKAVSSLDVDGAGNIYLTLGGLEDIYKLSPVGLPLAPGKPGESLFDVVKPAGVAVDVDGGVYAIEEEPTLKVVPEVSVVKYDATAKKLMPSAVEEAAEEFFPYVPFQGPQLNGIATNICAGSGKPGNLYIAAFQASTVSYVDAYGTPPIGCEPPPLRPPVIGAEFASAAGRTEASVRAKINPRFWDDTTYYVEYGTGKCSEGGCGAKAPAPPAPLTDQVINKEVMTAAVTLPGLLPGTTYRYRFVAESSGGGPAFGVERTLTTFRASGEVSPCPNDAFRNGAGAALPDCRGYEMVSPLDKANGDAALWIGRNGNAPRFFELDQSSVSGGRFAFTSALAFAEPESSPFVSQYLADRGSGGWASGSISAPRTESPVIAEFANEFQLFSDDLCSAWLRNNSLAPLAEGGVAKYLNLYRRENCTEPPSYTALSTVKPPKRTPEKYNELRTQGASEDGSHSIFVANGKLLPDAPTLKEEFELSLYEQTPEGLRFVCYLPSGAPIAQACAAGTGAGKGGANESSAHNAISADGRTIFWSAYSGGTGFGDTPGTPGQIYARIDGSETIKVSGSKAADPAWYWSAAEDGSKAIFAFEAGPLKDELYEFDVASKTPRLIAKGVEGPMGASEDASRIYFASKEDLDGGGPASAGAHNLYFYEAGEGGGTFKFIMALAARDVGGTVDTPAPVDEVPFQRQARISADGLHATFSSVASPTPTGYDNLDAASGEPDQEVYRYDAAAGELACVSCNPSGARPAGENINTPASPFWVAARIQGWEALGHAPRVLSEDGSRVYFESHEALTPRDTNGVWDVYQWEEPGKGSCSEADPSFAASSGGCVDLISSGESPSDSTFLDADPSGDNVFIGTQSSLVGADYGLNDVYDVRVGGGFPEPVHKIECEGEACQSPPAPPEPVTPASSTYRGLGNPKLAKPRGCPKGKRKVRRKGKARCAKPHKRAHHNGRAGK